MKIIRWFYMIMLIALISGCSTTTTPKTEVGGYKFTYNGREYFIRSISPKSQIGYNMLILKENDKIVIDAIDRNQDGTIDKVVVGDISVEDAQKIYIAGLSIGKDKGSVRERYMKSSTYETSDTRNDYILQTFNLAIGDIYNILTIKNKKMKYTSIVVLDTNSDGRLDKMKSGKGDLDYYQNLYGFVLNQGVKEGRIVKSNGKYLVAGKF